MRRKDQVVESAINTAFVTRREQKVNKDIHVSPSESPERRTYYHFSLLLSRVAHQTRSNLSSQSTLRSD